MRGFLIIFLLICITRSNEFLDYTQNHSFNCNTEIGDPLEAQWNILILHVLDQYFFLVLCPILILLELITLIVYFGYKELRHRPGDIVMGILLTSLILNCHFLATAIYYSIYSDSGPMPSSFFTFCNANGLIAIFCEILQTLYLIAMCLHIVHSLRRNLRFNQIRGIFIHITFVLLSALGVFMFWWFKYLGLNMYGTCSFRITNYTIPILASISAAVFIVLGYFSLSYFNKHMPETSGLRLKKYREARKYSLFIFGVSIIEIVNAALEFVAMVNCWSNQPNPAVYFVVTLVNLLRLAEFIFLLYVSTNSKLFRTKLRKMARICFCIKVPDRKGSSQMNVLNGQNIDENQQDPAQAIEQQLQDLLLPEGFGFTTLDALRVSQVSSIVMGILLSQMEYLSKISHTQTLHDNNYNEYIFTKYNQGVLLDYKLSVRNCPLINILHTSMLIYAPRMFRNMQIRDGLNDIAASFQLQANYENMFKIVQVQGGKSGEFFFFTTDNKYILKTINNQELNLLTNNLNIFDDYYTSNPNSLLTKIYGLFTFRGKQMQRTYHVILMKNILGCSRQNVERLYDMKGSSHDREVIKSGRLYNYNQLKSMTLKDLDFKKLEGNLRVEPQKAKQLYTALKLDSLFLKNLNLIDYSLLVAKISWSQELSEEAARFWSPIQRLKSTIQPKIYYHIGVIDYMQAWNIQKISEKWWKTLLGAEDVSAQQPDVYRIRFMDFVESIIPTNPPLTEKSDSASQNSG